MKDSLVLGVVEWRSKQYILSEGGGEDDGFLLYESNWSYWVNLPFTERDLFEDGCKQRWLTWTHFTPNPIKLVGLKVEVNAFQGRDAFLFPVAAEFFESYFSSFHWVFVGRLIVDGLESNIFLVDDAGKSIENNLNLKHSSNGATKVFEIFIE